MIKILFLTHTLSGGGAEKVLVDLVNNFDSSKFDITVETISDIGVYKNKLNANIKYKSMSAFSNDRISKFFGGIIAHFFPANLAHKAFIRDKYDFEVAFLEGAPTRIIAGSNNMDSIKIAWLHTDLVNNFKSNGYYLSETSHKRTYQKYDKIICVSQKVLEGFISKFGMNSKLSVSYNLYDTSEIIKKSLEPIGFDENNRCTIVSVGRLTPEKGYDRLIEVIAKLVVEGFPIDLWIVGEGRERQSLENKIRELRISDRVTLFGFQENPYKYIKNADLFVSSSRVEGYSTVIAEALILSKPVIATDCSGVDELLQNGKYGIIAKNSTEDIYHSLKKVLCDRSLFINLMQKANERSKDFDMDVAIKKLQEIFEAN
jgi:glycosyltransferase involved in cell wall biosynthesis